jgi:glycogen(starch) synthase
MKIGFLITYFYPQTGGAESNCYYLARELAKKHEVHVFCSGNEDIDETIEGIHVHRSKQIFRIKYYFAYYPSLIDSLARYDLDILHVHGLGFVQHDKAVKALKQAYPDTKVVCTPHGPFMALKKYNLLGSLFKKAYTPSIRKGLASYNALIQVNPYQKEWMTKEYRVPPRKIFFVPNGIPQSSFIRISQSSLNAVRKKYEVPQKHILAYIGRIQKYKGLDQVIRALPLLPQCIFLAIGKDAGDRARLESIAKEKGVSERVIFTGEVSEKDKLALLELSDIFAFPSEWEAFGIGMLEAMARGNALVSTRTEGGRYLVREGKNGYLFDHGDISGLAQNVNKIVNNPRTMGRMQSYSRTLARTFTWEKISVTLEKLYRRLIR